MVALNSGASYEQIVGMLDSIRVWLLFTNSIFYINIIQTNNIHMISKYKNIHCFGNISYISLRKAFTGAIKSYLKLNFVCVIF